jgi:phosphoglycolate phosphatase
MRRLILFDIDGTILSTHGAAKTAFHRALLDSYGTAGPIDDHAFDGKTDPQIVRELLRLAGLSDARIDAGHAAFWPRYLANLRQELARPGYRTLLYPGVAELIDALEARPDDAVLALLTGNVAGGADLKLHSVGLADRFPFGAFGSDHERRADLPALAVQRAFQHTGRLFREHDVIIIGDTPSDMSCGRAVGARAVGVTTGRHDANALHAAGADAVVPDLADTAALLELLLGDGVLAAG